VRVVVVMRMFVYVVVVRTFEIAGSGVAHSGKVVDPDAAVLHSR
jgi:hypothetical protein